MQRIRNPTWTAEDQERAAFEKQLRKGEGDARQLQDQLREIDAQIAALEEAVVNDASRDA